MMPLHFITPDQHQPSAATLSTIPTSTGKVFKPFRGKGYTFWLALVLCVLAIIYWGLVASNRYVSEAHVIIQQTDMPMNQTMGLSSLLGMSGAPNRADQLLPYLLLFQAICLFLKDILELKRHQLTA